MSQPVAVPPGPGFVAGLRSIHGMHLKDQGGTAQLAITHGMPRQRGETFETIEAGMRALACALHLGPIEDEPRFIGARLQLHRGLASLDYGDDYYVFRIPGTSQEWQRHVIQGGKVRVLVSFTPSPYGLSQEGWDEYMTECVQAGMVRWGTTSGRRI
ncbi:hypothetical protein [Streptomyces chryseus]